MDYLLESGYLAKGVKARSNAELVSKMIRIMREFDFEPATPQEAREILNLTTRRTLIKP